MKKIFSALLTLILLFSLCVAVFADEPESLEEYEADVSQLYNVEAIDETETGDSVQNEVIEVTTDGNSVQDEVIEVTTDDDSIQDEATDVTAADDSIQTETVNETAADNYDGAEIADEANPDSEATPSVDLAQADIFNVKIAWSGMNFTYVDGDKGDWDPESCTYKGGEGSQGYWMSDSGTDGCGRITITNNASANTESEDNTITAILSFKRSDQYHGSTAVMRYTTDTNVVPEKENVRGWKDIKSFISDTRVLELGVEPAGKSKTIYLMPTLGNSDNPSDNPELVEGLNGYFGDISIVIAEGFPIKLPLPDSPEIE